MPWAVEYQNDGLSWISPNVMTMGDASLDLEDVSIDGEDGPYQPLAGSVVAGGVGAMDTLADMTSALVGLVARSILQLGFQQWTNRMLNQPRRDWEILSSSSG